MRVSLLALLSVIHYGAATLTTTEMTNALNTLNAFRSAANPTASNMLKLYWSNALQLSAQQWANNCTYGFSSDPSSASQSLGGSGSTYSYVGEAVYLYSAPTSDAATKAIIGWQAENSSYTYSTTSGCSSSVCGSCTDSNSECLDYTQNMWASTQFLGCAAATCSSISGLSGFCSSTGCTWVVCHYAAGGNYIGETPYTSGTACSACPSSANVCSSNLCSSSSTLGDTIGSANLTLIGGSTSTPAPTAAPTTAAPTLKPTTAAPTTAKPTAAPTTATPSTAAPTKAPTTAAPTAKPTTGAPTTASPSAAPTTAKPTSSPTAKPTSAPTTAAPTSSVKLPKGMLSATAMQNSLAMHNLFRAHPNPAASNMNQLYWSNALELTALNYLANTCTFAHNPSRTTDATKFGGTFSYVGENLYVSTGTDSNSGVTAVISWQGENSSYTFPSSQTCNTGDVCGTCASGVECGHYTQNMWATTTYVGCAAVVCNSVSGFVSDCTPYGGCTLVMCDYGEGGNYVGQAPWETGTACSACPSGTTCLNGLCALNAAGTGGDTPGTANYGLLTPSSMSSSLASATVSQVSSSSTSSSISLEGKVAVGTGIGLFLAAVGAAAVIIRRRRQPAAEQPLLAMELRTSVSALK